MRLTKDGVVITFHDDSFKRLAGVDKKINDVDYKDFPNLLDQIPMHFTNDYKLKLSEKNER